MILGKLKYTTDSSSHLNMDARLHGGDQIVALVVAALERAPLGGKGENP